MERVSDEWLNHTIKNGVDRTIGDYYSDKPRAEIVIIEAWNRMGDNEKSE